MSFHIYILRFADNGLYIGQTNNLDVRLEQHRSGKIKASKFSKEHGLFELAYTEKFSTRTESMRREKQLKGWTRTKKEALIRGDMQLLKKL